jgi:L-threonylcarbamoyladenylate synthase
MVTTLTPHDHTDEAVRALKSGGVIAFPTETFYGLGVDPFNVEAVERLFKLKGRSFKDPIPVVVADMESVKGIVETVPPLAETLIERYWPGPLTIVFNAKETVPAVLTAHTGKIGVRIPGNPQTRRLVKAYGSPITSTSANPSGSPPAAKPSDVLDYFDGLIEVLIDGGTLTAEKPSTVVDVTGGRIEVIREGAVETAAFSDLLSN